MPAIVGALLWPTQPVWAKSTPAGEPVVVVDLVGDTIVRDALIGALAVDPRIIIDDKAKTWLAQADITAHETTGTARRELELAKLAFGALDCVKTRRHSRAAISALSPAELLPSIRQLLTTAETYMFRCADGEGRTGAAAIIAMRLRRLGHSSPPRGIAGKQWDAYPELDASSNTKAITLAIATKPAGAEVWVDHERVGSAPITVLVRAGDHVVHARSGKAQHTAQKTQFADGSGPIELVLAKRFKHPAAGSLAGRWRTEKRPPRSSEMGEFLRHHGRRIALVLGSSGQVYIWALPKDTKFARRVSAAPAGKPRYVAKLVWDWVSAADGAGFDPSVPLLREEPGDKREAKKTRSWWVYAAVVGAAVVGGSLIIANELSTDKQRIELDIP